MLLIESRRKIFFKYTEFVLILILSLLAGYNIIYETTDSVIYASHYNSVSWDNYLGDEVYFEYLYKLLVSFSKLILNIDYGLFASLLAFVSLQIKFYLFSKRPYSIYLKIAYLLTLYPFYESLRMRAGLAIALVYLAIELRHRKVLSLLFVLFGAFLHNSLMPFILFWIFYNYLKDIRKVKSLIKLGLIFGIIVLVLFKYIDFIFGFLDFRVLAYIIEDQGYFNIWILPKYFLLGWISYLILKEKLDSLNSVLIFIGTFFVILSFTVIKINMLSLSLLDLGIFAYFLVATNPHLKNKTFIRFLFIVMILMEISLKIFQLPVLLLYLLK